MTEQSKETKPCPEPIACSIAVELARLKGETRADVRALTEVVKALKASSESAFVRGEKLMGEHEDRLDNVERKVWWASGAAAGAASAITAAITFIVTYMKLKGGGGRGG